MLSAAVIVFREVLEAALIVGILLAATCGLPGRTRWIGAGLLAGLAGACLVAFFAGSITGAFDGFGQELMNAGILIVAVLMLAWHNIWMSHHAKELVAHLKNVSAKITDGTLPLYFLAVASGMAVLREGSEVVLFMYSVAASGSSSSSMLLGSLAGVVAGVLVGRLLYSGLLRIPASRLFQITGWMILLLAAGLAASAAGYLMQAGVMPYRAPLWDSGDILSEKSALGQLLHILVGYQERPTSIQIGVYLVTLFTILTGMRWVGRRSETKLRAA
ncbi:FTR1 family iron permease [Marinobacterium sp. YM272]|uniref:FTR1 family iron permease n=1 Tax=Marinobacterium sp. YM272 TaxID=3421654 RepID=UPI003D7F3BE9